MSQNDLYLLKFGKPANECDWDAVCKVCTLRWCNHFNADCRRALVSRKKFGSQYNKGKLDAGCTVCGQKYANHYGDFGYVCPAQREVFYETLGLPTSVKQPDVIEPPYIYTKKPKKVITYVPRTQKAIGIQALKQYYRAVPSFSVYAANKIEPSNMLGYFCRPCPMLPRHGFVDSRVVSNEIEANAIIKETLSADPEAEFIVMDKIDAKYSGIWTPGLLSIGRGHDGATAGTSAVSIPTMGTPFHQYANGEEILEAAKIKNAPYLELLWESSTLDVNFGPYEVQLRDGPKLDNLSTDFIPEEVTVRKVLLAEGDLLDWESLIKSHAAIPGTVVYHPKGTLASHYSIHAVLSKIPVLISRQPVLGEVLKPTNESTQKTDIDAIQAGFMLAIQSDIKPAWIAYVMLAGCHHIAVWRGRYDILLGIAIGAAYRLTVTAVLGEFRHEPYNTDEGKGRYKRRTRPLSRDTIYDRVYKNTDSTYHRIRFRKALEAFVNESWDKGFGGESWFRFAQWALVMYNHLVVGNADRALECLNSLVHSAHNNGWGFNKFVTDEELDKTAKNPVYALLRCAGTMYESLVLPKDTVLELSGKFRKYRRKIKEIEHDIELSSTKIIKAQAKLLETDKGNILHIQYVLDNMPGGYLYYTVEHIIPLVWKELASKGYAKAIKVHSLSGESTEYAVITSPNSDASLAESYFFSVTQLVKTKGVRT